MSYNKTRHLAHLKLIDAYRQHVATHALVYEDEGNSVLCQLLLKAQRDTEVILARIAADGFNVSAGDSDGGRQETQ